MPSRLEKPIDVSVPRLRERHADTFSNGVPEMGISDAILENDERDFEHWTLSGIDDFEL